MWGVVAINQDKVEFYDHVSQGCMLSARCPLLGHLFSTVAAFYGGLVLGILLLHVRHILPHVWI